MPNAPLQDQDVARQMLRALLHEIVNGVVLADEKGTILSFNPGAEKLFGWSAAEVIGKNVTRLMPEPYRSHHHEYMRHYLETGMEKVIGIGREVTALHRDGSTFKIHLALSEIEVQGIRQFVGIITRITTSANIERILDAMQSVVRGGLKRAIEALEESAGKTAVLNEFDRLDRIMHQAEMHFRIETIPMSFRDLELREFLSQLLGSHRGRVKIHGITFQDNRPLMLQASAKYLDLMFQTLLENAGRYAPDGQASINVARLGDVVLVSMTNKGLIKPEHIKYLFELVPHDEKEDEGRPFGLSLVNAYLVAKRHGGDISCQSVKGTTTFIVRLPLAPVESPA